MAAPIKRRVRDIEEVLAWAFKHELPKRKGDGRGSIEPSDVSPMFRHADLGVRVDWTREPGLPAALGEVHPDALKVEAAVKALVRLEGAPFAVEELELAPDFPLAACNEAAAMRRALSMAGNIVIHHAKAGTRPYWTAQTPSVYGARGANGRATVLRWETRFERTVAGTDQAFDLLVPVSAEKREVYPYGSYCALRYDPDPQAMVVDRAEYLAWWTALSELAAELCDLEDFTVMPPSAAQKPWLGEVDLSKPPRVFQDLTTRAYRAEVRETAAAHRQLGLRRIRPARRGEPAIALARRRHMAVTGTTDQGVTSTAG